MILLLKNQYLSTFDLFRSPLPVPDLMQHPVVTKIATKHNKSNAQILLKYLMELGMAVIPKSVNPERIRENFQVEPLTLLCCLIILLLALKM